MARFSLSQTAFRPSDALPLISMRTAGLLVDSLQRLGQGRLGMFGDTVNLRLARSPNLSRKRGMFIELGFALKSDRKRRKWPFPPFPSPFKVRHKREGEI